MEAVSAQRVYLQPMRRRQWHPLQPAATAEHRLWNLQDSPGREPKTRDGTVISVLWSPPGSGSTTGTYSVQHWKQATPQGLLVRLIV